MTTLRAAGPILLLLSGAAGGGSAQAPAKVEFDVASVRENVTDGTPDVNVPLTNTDLYPANGGVLRGRNIPLINYIGFAYKLASYQQKYLQSQVPAWVATGKYNIEARSERHPTKDQMRAMMQALLAERFGLAVRMETRQVGAFELVLAKPGKTGPQLTRHAEDAGCAGPPSPSGAAPAAGAPGMCGGFGPMAASKFGLRHIGGEKVTMAVLAGALAGPALGNFDRPVLDRTGLAGAYDFQIEFVPDPPMMLNGAPVDTQGATFLEALTEQLGLKVESKKDAVEFVVIDHIAPLSAN